MRFISEAFNLVCPDSQEPKPCYVVLYERVRAYLGPWEGGTYGDDITVIKYQLCDTVEEANAIKERVEKIAQDLTNNARREHGEKCLREMEWCELRGLDADYLPEPDGPSEYFVGITEDYPSSSYAKRGYE